MPLVLLTSLAISPIRAEKGQTPSLILTGVKDKVADNIRNYVDLSEHSCDLPEWRLKRLEKVTKKNTTKALRALGYYHPVIKLKVGHKKTCWKFNLNIKPGQQARLRNVNISVNGGLENTQAYQIFRNNLPLQKGHGLNHGDYEKTKREIQTLASRFGFFEGKFSHHQLFIDPVKNIADIDLTFKSGSRYRIGRLTIEQHQFNDTFIHKYLKIHENQAYDSQDLTKQQQVFNDSGYFSSVEITATREPNVAHKIPINIHLTERKKNAYQVGVGASTNEGPRTRFSYKNRWANRRGHHYSVDTRWSPVVSEASLNYIIPVGDSGRHRWELGFGYRTEKTDTTLATTVKSGAKLIKVLSNGWNRTLFLDALQEKFTAGNDDDKVLLLMPGIGLNKSKRDRLKLPRKGWRLSLTIKTAFEDFLSDINLAQLAGSAKIIRPLGKGRVLANVSAGFTEVNQFSKLPVSLRFYAGGDNSVRGFGYKTLGPKNADNEVTGGKHLLTGSLEYEYPFKQNWGAAIFIDTGNAFNDISDDPLHTGIGFGLRYHSPIGPVRLDVAQDIEGDELIRLHLSMGPDL
jgi:translocation and assembly module TamA